jgi:dTDP-glucose 4,6-dehydratase
MQKILVTGGAGFIGSNFIEKLLAQTDLDVFILDNLTYAANLKNLPSNILLNSQNDRCQFFHGNIINEGIVNNLVSQSDYIVHFAAETHVTRSIYDNKHFFETDVIGTQCIANAVLKNREKIKKFIHISTSEVYGSAESTLMDESHVLNPASPYAAAKCGADRLVYSYWNTYKIPAIIIRPFNNYGPRQHLEKAIPRFITNAILGEDIIIHGDGSARRDYIFVDDLCIALIDLISNDNQSLFGEVINIGSGKDISILEIANDILKLMQSNTKIKFVGDRPGQVFRHTADFTKARAAINWKPTTLWSEGISKTINWYLNNKENWAEQLWMRKVPIINASGKREFH